MAIKRLYVHRDRLDETVDALADRLAERGGRRRPGRRGDHGPGAHGRARATGWRRLVAEAAAAGARRAPAGPRADEDEASGGYFVSPALVVAPAADARASCARSSSPRPCP